MTSEDQPRYAEVDFIDAYHYTHWRELPEGTKMVPPLPEDEVVSFEYGHTLSRNEKSQEVYRIGGLMDQIDATEILKGVFLEAGVGIPEDMAERLAEVALARLTRADPPILACRVYEV